MLLILLPLLVAVGGACIYILSTNTKAAELGRIAYFVGLFFVVSALASHVVKLG